MNRNAIAFVNDCRIPDGWIVCDLKVCENCGMTFVRTGHIKFCAPCCQRLLMPPIEEVYREALPQIPFHPNHELVHYDDSLRPKKVVGRLMLEFPRERRLQGKLGNWMERLKEALRTKGMMTRKEMIKITGHIDERSLNSMLVQRKLKLERVASMWPRIGRGMPTGYYKLSD